VVKLVAEYTQHVSDTVNSSAIVGRWLVLGTLDFSLSPRRNNASTFTCVNRSTEAN